MSEATTFSRVERINHWIVAVATLLLLSAGWVLFFKVLSEPAERSLRDLHKAFGVLVLVFGLWRVGYRLLRGFPQPVPGMQNWQLLLSKLVHYLLLAGIIIMPASGFFKSWYAGRPINMFGLFSMGSPGNKDAALAELASTAHYLAGLAITALIVLHIVAAVKHHLFDRDGTLTRMIRG